ncbi:efflux RND transporter periplasmic adaptor subunit [Alteromonas sp. W364]|uniref:efflux RND transporter periplasmic adaptor subunit n=1 Tax=Alteromonas sp. W364 TaxID=3075610 RepID=UPI002886C8F1|nr:efflux RND transporter periplasmic adaptor subunit [Alteromonas sp. W364]MDT0627576.1 efflux RND transporter periplasmic adaptor subunit [Alteromonas sp. W364]
MQIKMGFGVVVILVMVLSACSKSETDASESTSAGEGVPAGKKVWSTVLVPASEGRKRHLTGTIQAADAVSISFEVTGVVAKMHVDLGQSFEQGQLLAELDTAVYVLAVKQNESNLGEAEAALTDAKQTFERNNTLRKQGLVAQAALDNAKASYDIAQQRVEVARSALALSKENLSDTKLHAPYAGRVSARMVEPSQQIVAGSSVLSIQGNAKLEVSAAIPEGLIGKVSLFDKVRVVVPSIDTKQSFPATLSEIGAQASVANAFPITVTFDENHQGFYPGMSAELILQVKSDYDNEALFDIPLSAFSTDGKESFIYLIEPTENQANDLKVHKTLIDIMELKSDSAVIRIQDQASLRAEQRIVRTGLDFLRDKQRVSVVETETRIYNQ